MAHPSRVFLDEIARSVAINPPQSAAIVSLVCSRLERWIAAKNPDNVVIPSLADLAVDRGGHLWWYRGRAVPQARAIAAVGALLDSLLQQGPPGRVPAGLLYVVARATDPRHLAPFASLADLRSAVARHAPEQPAFAIDGLLAQYLMAASGCEPLRDDSSISDVRRLRRAGGVTLPRIAEDTGIPLSLLRELEWGVFANWDPAYASGSLEAYAERAGLDSDQVMAVVRRERDAEQVTLVRVSVPPLPAPVRSKTLGLVPFALAAALAAFVVATAPADRNARQLASVGSAAGSSARPASLTTAEAAPAPRGDVRPAAVPGSSKASLEKPRTRVPRRARHSPSSSTRSVQPAQSRHALARFARAVAGDGRHKVEPFPKVQP